MPSIYDYTVVICTHTHLGNKTWQYKLIWRSNFCPVLVVVKECGIGIEFEMHLVHTWCIRPFRLCEEISGSSKCSLESLLDSQALLASKGLHNGSSIGFSTIQINWTLLF